MSILTDLTHDQETLSTQLTAMKVDARRRRRNIVIEEKEAGSGARTRRKPEEMILRAARRCDLDAILVWRLECGGRPVLDPIGTLQELHAVGVEFVSLAEALDETTPGGRTLAGMFDVFAEFERDILWKKARAVIAHAREEGRPHGRPATVTQHVGTIRRVAVNADVTVPRTLRGLDPSQSAPAASGHAHKFPHAIASAPSNAFG